MKPLTLGSLFDGSAGFPLGGLLCGITPLWASEIEPFPIRVTTKRLPHMQHLGDVSKINGAEIPPVDIITFGSPCTDMSVAGKRAGLDGSQSVLFYEAIRIVREMREATNGAYPRFICWENVPGAFSSNRGNDFKAVLDAVVQIASPQAEVPAPAGGKWPYADVLLGAGWSVAYRTVDAQYFGVAQRRRRIYLVADFAGECAGEILFECQGVSRNSAESELSWQRTADSAQGGAGAAGRNECVASLLTVAYGTNWNGNCGAYSGDSFAVESPLLLNDQGGQRMNVSEDTAGTLRAEAHHPLDVIQPSGFCPEHSEKGKAVGYEAESVASLPAGIVSGIAIENHPIDGRCKISEDGTVQTLTSRMGTGGMNTPLVLDQDRSAALQAFGICSDGSNAMRSSNPHSGIYEADTARTLDANGGNPGCNQGGIAVVAFAQNQRNEVRDLKDRAGALAADPGMKQQTYVAAFKYGNSAKARSIGYEVEKSPTLAGAPGGNQTPVICLQGSMIGRAEKNGPQGNGIDEDVSFTLNTIDRHAVAVSMTTGSYTQVIEEQSPTLMSRDYKDAPIVTRPASFYLQMKAESQCFRQDDTANTLINGTNPGYQNGVVSSEYVVRRLTPTECARLQGFPDWWCAGLETVTPSEDEIAWWADVFETHRRIMGTSSKPKTRAQIIKWLQAPYSDAAEYKMWGNGVALPCVVFVLSGIVQMVENIDKT